MAYGACAGHSALCSASGRPEADFDLGAGLPGVCGWRRPVGRMAGTGVFVRSFADFTVLVEQASTERGRFRPKEAAGGSWRQTATETAQACTEAVLASIASEVAGETALFCCSEASSVDRPQCTSTLGEKNFVRRGYGNADARYVKLL